MKKCFRGWVRLRRYNKIAILGSVTRDIIAEGTRIGGSAYYGGLALLMIDVNPLIITNSVMLKDFLGGYSELIGSEDGKPAEFRIEQGNDGRVLKLMSRPTPIPLDDEILRIISTDYDAVVVTPVFQDLSLEDLARMIPHLRGWAVIDIQGYVREALLDGIVRNSENRFWRVFEVIRNHINVILRGEVNEFPSVCRGMGIENCLKDFNGYIIQTSGDGPIYFGRGGSVYRLDIYCGIHGDDTGAGDVFTSLLGAFWSPDNYIFAVSAAAAGAMLKTVRHNKIWFTEHEIRVHGHELAQLVRKVM